MSNQAAARNPSQNPPHLHKEDGRDHTPNGAPHNTVPLPSATPALVNAVKSLDSAPNHIATLREKPETFDSPYARSATSTAPGSPRM